MVDVVMILIVSLVVFTVLKRAGKNKKPEQADPRPAPPMSDPLPPMYYPPDEDEGGK